MPSPESHDAPLPDDHSAGPNLGVHTDQDPQAKATANRADQAYEVVVLGAGFAGLGFARRFKHVKTADGRPVRVTLIDKENHHLFQPLLYQVATAALAAPEIAEPIRALFRRRKDVDVVMDEVEHIDLDKQEVRCCLETYRYDQLVIGLGGFTSYFGNNEWAKHAPGLKSLADAFLIRKQMLTAFERAETVDTDDEKRRLMRTVVVGGGPTGVELAGAMADLTRRIWAKDFRHIDITHAQVILVDGGDRLLKSYPEKLSEAAKKQLEEMGVEIRLNTRVTNIKAHRVWLRDETGTIRTHGAGTILWGGGVQAAKVLSTMGVEQDRAGRVKVEPGLTIPGHPNVMCLGDAANITNPDGSPVPGVAPAAMQMGAYAAKVLRQEITGKTDPDQREPFVYVDKGSMATIGRSKAVAHLYNRLPLEGFSAWMVWLLVHLLFLVGFRNKVVTLIQWIYQYASFRSGARIIPSADRPDPRTYDVLRNADLAPGSDQGSAPASNAGGGQTSDTAPASPSPEMSKSTTEADRAQREPAASPASSV